MSEVFTPNPKHLDGVPDLCQLEYLEEDNVLHNLNYRYSDHAIYTSTTSKVLVAINPYTAIPGSDAKETMDKYHNLPMDMEGFADSKDTPPNVFAVAHAAYSRLCLNKDNQSCIVCGESGSGKTESAKLIMKFLAYSSTSGVSGDKLEQADAIGKQVLDANPILESIGNAKTLLNDNSSRFGKFTKMLFEAQEGTKSLMLIGAEIEQFLLEKSRVVKQEQGERNFHIFYYMCTPLAKQKWPEFQMQELTDYHYTNQSNCFSKKKGGVEEDTADLEELLESYATLRIPDEQQKGSLAIVAAVMHLGNIEFEAKGQGSALVNPELATLIANILEVDEQKLITRLTKAKLIMPGNREVIKELTPEAALINRDSMAKQLYHGLFAWTVNRINKQSIPTGADTSLWIGTLDVFGFEIFEQNSFEQMCINFCNERLQDFFNYHVLKSEQDLYLSEALLWDPVDLPDNSDCIDLFTRKPNGVLAILDGSCKMPKANDKSFVDTLLRTGAHKRLRKVSRRKGRGGQYMQINGFTIKHYAGDVIYDATGFLFKNKNEIHADTAALFGESKQTVCAEILSTPGKKKESKRPATSNKSTVSRRTGSRKANTSFISVGSTFAEQLQNLMTTLGATNPYFIRCIKPNTVKKPWGFDKEYVRPQLRCGGLIQALRIIKCGFPVRCPYAKIWQKFGAMLEDYMTPKNINYRDFTEAVMLKVGEERLSTEEYQLGRTMVFFRPGKQTFLQNILAKGPSDVSDNTIEEIRDHMVRKRIVRATGSLRAFSRIKHTITKARIVKVAGMMRVYQRTLGRALTAARGELGKEDEDRKRKARLADAEYQAALKAKEDIKKLAKEAEEKDKFWAKKMADEKSKIDREASDKKKIQAQLQQARNECKSARSELASTKRDLMAASQNASKLKSELDSKSRTVTGMEADLKRSKEQLVSLKTDSQQKVQKLQEQLHTLQKTSADSKNAAERSASEMNQDITSKANQINQLKNQLEDVQSRLKTSEEESREAKAQYESSTRGSTASYEQQLREKEAKIANLQNEKMILENKAAGDAQAAARTLSEANSNIQRLENEMQDKEADIGGLQHQLKTANDKLAFTKKQSESELSTLQAQLSDLKRTSSDKEFTTQTEAREQAAKLAALRHEYDLFKSQSTETEAQLRAAHQDCKDENAKIRSTLEELRTEKEAQLSDANGRISALTTQLEELEAQRRADNTSAYDEQKRLQDAFSAKQDGLLRRIRELEAALNKANTDRQLALEKLQAAQSRLDRLETTHANFKAEANQTIADLQARLERAQNDATSASDSRQADRRQYVQQINELSKQLSETKQAHRVDNDNNERQIWELTQTMEQQTRELNDLKDASTDQSTRLERQIDSIRESLEDERKTCAQLREQAQAEASNRTKALQALKDEFKAEKIQWQENETKQGEQNRELVSQNTSLQQLLKNADAKVTALAETNAANERSFKERIEQLRTQHSTEIMDLNARQKQTMMELSTASSKLNEIATSGPQHARELELLKSKHAKQVHLLEADYKAAMAKVNSFDERRRRDIQDATTGLEGQLSMYKAMIEDLKIDKQSNMDVVATLHQQVRDANISLSNMKSLHKAAERKIGDLKYVHSMEQKSAEQRSLRERTSLRERMQNAERQTLEARDSYNGLLLERKQLQDANDAYKSQVDRLKRESAQAHNNLEELENTQRAMLRSNAAYEEKLRTAREESQALEAKSNQSVMDSQSAVRQLELKISQLEQAMQHKETEFATSEDAHASDLKRIKESHEDDIKSKTVELEQEHKLNIRVLEQQNKTLSMEAQYHKLQNDVTKQAQQDFADKRMQYEQKITQLTAQLHEATEELGHIDATFTSYKSHAEATQNHMKAEFEYQVNQLKQDHRSAMRSGRDSNAIREAASLERDPYAGRG